MKTYNYRVGYIVCTQHETWYTHEQEVEGPEVDLDNQEDLRAKFLNKFDKGIHPSAYYIGIAYVELIGEVLDEQAIISALKDAVEDFFDEYTYKKEREVVLAWLEKQERKPKK